jgi:hypothetical protein
MVDVAECEKISDLMDFAITDAYRVCFFIYLNCERASEA